MTEEELESAIQMEAAQHIPFDIGEVNLDYQVLDSAMDSPTMDVLLVAVKKDKILNYTNVVTLAGRTPTIVDIDAFALQNVYEYNYDPPNDLTVALLNLGSYNASMASEHCLREPAGSVFLPDRTAEGA